jgi:hypothetical protein
LECAYQCDGVWQHIHNSNENKINQELDSLYHKLNKKLALTKHPQTRHNNRKNQDTQPRLINLTHIPLQEEHIHTLTLGPNYAIEKHPKQYINELIIDTESAIRQLDPKIQSPLRYLASTKIKQVLACNIHHTLHKRHQCNINQVKEILHKNDLTIARADKHKATVIIRKETMQQKIDKFIKDNDLTRLKKDPTETFHTQTQKALQTCDTLIEKDRLKCLLNIKPMAPNLNAYIKTHKEGAPSDQ